MHNIDGIIHFAPHTGRLTGMVTNAAADDGERIILFDKFESFFKFALADQSHITLNADMGRTIGFTGRCPQLVDGKTAGNGLREMPVDSLSFT